MLREIHCRLRLVLPSTQEVWRFLHRPKIEQIECILVSSFTASVLVSDLGNVYGKIDIRRIFTVTNGFFVCH